MASIALARSDVIVGVDTHKDQHVAVALDGLGGDLDDRSIDATNDGYGELVAWALGLGRVVAFGVEGCGSYGIGLARFLRRHGHKVIEVSRPPRKGQRRLAGKSDLIEARHAAREVLAGNATATPKSASGTIESIRLVKIVRDTAVKAHTAAMITLKATLVTAADELRGELEPLSDFKLITACAALASNGDLTDPGDAMRHALGALARRWLELHEEIKVHSRQLKTLTKQAAPGLVEAFGIGPDIAGELLAAAGDNTDRVRSEAAFAKLSGSCPIPAGSGKTNGRHRLNRGGNRQANAALYRCVIVRMRWHAPTIAYVERRTAEVLSKRRSSAASSATSPARSTRCYPRRPPPPPSNKPHEDLTIYRSINALVESFNGLYKWELIYPQGPWAGLEDVEWATLSYVDWFNQRRLHGEITEGPGYTTPTAFEAAHYPQTTPALDAGIQ